MAGNVPGSGPGTTPGAPGSDAGPPAERDEITESIEQALKAAQAQTAAAAAKAASAAASAPGEGGRPGGEHQAVAGLGPGVASRGDWSRMQNRISAEQHRENGSRAPKRYRRQVDEYFRSIARESAKKEEEAKP